MKILLTGHPKAGKSTILEKFRANYTGKMVGVIGHAITAEDGSRLGFEAENMQGERKMYAHKTLIKSDFVVGNKFFVDVAVIDGFFVPELRKSLGNIESLVLLDEIGRMQSFSPLFLNIVRETLNSNASVLGTIVYDPEPWSIEFKNHPEVILVNVTEQNRDALLELLLTIFSHEGDYQKLDKGQRELVKSLLREYFEKNAFVQIKKLFNNAIPYVLGNKITQGVKPFEYIVKGNTRGHKVIIERDKTSCDCDLFNGKGEYIGQNGECSHIQAVKLLKVK